MALSPALPARGQANVSLFSLSLSVSHPHSELPLCVRPWFHNHNDNGHMTGHSLHTCPTLSTQHLPSLTLTTTLSVLSITSVFPFRRGGTETPGGQVPAVSHRAAWDSPPGVLEELETHVPYPNSPNTTPALQELRREAEPHVARRVGRKELKKR